MVAAARLALVAAALAGLMSRAAAADRTALGAPRVACLRALAPLSPDSIADSSRFERARCPAGKIASAFRYDRAHGDTRLARAVCAGQIVPVFPEFGTDTVRPGQMIDLVVALGPVRIERQVEALQAARPGQRLFVRSRDGQILSARFEAAAP